MNTLTIFTIGLVIYGLLMIYAIYENEIRNK